MNGARAFFVVMFCLLVFAFGILVESTINDSEHEQLLQQTHNVQVLFWKTQQLEQELSVCNYDAGNTISIELIAPVTRGMIR